MNEEIRVTNDKTGGEKGSKLARLDLVPVYPLWTVAELYGHGAKKYAARNWERGYDWSLSYAALQRHLLSFWAGEDLIPQTPEGEPDDPTAGVPHLAAVAWHAFALLEFMKTHPELDDRPDTVQEVEEDEKEECVESEASIQERIGLTRQTILEGFESGIWKRPDHNDLDRNSSNSGNFFPSQDMVGQFVDREMETYELVKARLKEEKKARKKAKKAERIEVNCD